MPNHTITIGNTTPSAFADWLDSSYDSLRPEIGCTIVGAIGYYAGTREDSVSVTLYGMQEQEVRGLLTRYGKDHPGEECFGLSRAPDSYLLPNEHRTTEY